MSDIEKELKKVLKANGSFDADKNAAKRKEIEQMIFQKFQTDIFKVKIVFWIFAFIGAGACLPKNSISNWRLKRAASRLANSSSDVSSCLSA